MAVSDNPSMAVFCDFENVALGVRDAKYDKFDIKRVLERLLLKGSIVVKKAYCDWERYKAFKATMHEASFELIEIPHVRQSGKNSADIRMVVDALDLCYTKSHVDTFVIISGDSDFSPLVSKLRENAKQVIGVGVKQSTSDLLIANCDEFIFYDDLVRESARAATPRRAAAEAPSPGKRLADDDAPGAARREDPEARRRKALDLVAETFEALMAERGASGRIWASVLKDAIKRRRPDFNEGYFGFRTFGALLDEAQARGLLEVGRDDKSNTYVRRLGAAAVLPSSNVPPVVQQTEWAEPVKEDQPVDNLCPSSKLQPPRAEVTAMIKEVTTSPVSISELPTSVMPVARKAVRGARKAPATKALQADEQAPLATRLEQATEKQPTPARKVARKVAKRKSAGVA